MNKPPQPVKKKTEPMDWLARVVSVLAILGGIIPIVDVLRVLNLEVAAQQEATLFIGLALLLIAIIGLALAWKWRLPGAVTALVAFAIMAIVNPRVLSSLHLLIPVAAILFLVSGLVASKVPTSPVAEAETSKEEAGGK